MDREGSAMRWILVLITMLVMACGGDDAQLSESDYRDRVVEDVLGPLGESTGEIGRIAGQLEDRPELIDNDDWKSSMFNELDKMDDAHKEAELLTPPDELEEAHEVLLAGTECFSDTVDRLRPAVKVAYTSEIMRAQSLATRCLDFLGDATEAMNAQS